MPSNKVVIHVVVLPVLIALAIIAAVSLSRIHYLSLPISTATPIAAIVLPLLTGLGIQGAQRSLLAHSSATLTKRRSPPPWLLPTLFVVLVIYDTVIATVSVTQMLPSSALTCQLSEKWLQLWKAHDGNAVRRIQDAHRCCGFRTVKNMAWPFDGNQGKGTCSKMYGREGSCLGPWRRDLQVQAGMVLLVALGTFAVKIVVLVLYRGRDSFVRRGYAALTAGEDDGDGDHQDHAQDRSRGRIEAPYRDDVASDAGTEDVETGRREQGHIEEGEQRRDSNMILQPASVGRPENEWRT